MEIVCNSRYATKIFEKANKPNKYKDIWAYILTDLLPLVQRGTHFHSIQMSHGSPESQQEKDMRQCLMVGLLNRKVPLITTVDSCLDFLAQLEPLPLATLQTLQAGRGEETDVFSTSATDKQPWLSNPKDDSQTTVLYHKSKSVASSDMGGDSLD